MGGIAYGISVVTSSHMHPLPTQPSHMHPLSTHKCIPPPSHPHICTPSPCSHMHPSPLTHAPLPLTPSQTTNLQPGLKLLLEGEVAASASTFSLGDQDAVLEGSTHLTPTGSLRHSRHSSRRSSKRSSTSEVRGVRGVGVRGGYEGCGCGRV